MKKVIDFLFSTRLTLVLLLIFAASLGIATFIEEKFDTITSKLLIYNALWFEIVLFLMALNFLGNIWKFKLLSGKKWAMLTFHLAFVLVIIGAGVTRYFGFEGNMHIREGESSDFIFSSTPYLLVELPGKNQTLRYEKEMVLSQYLDTDFHLSVNTETGSSSVEIKGKRYFKNAVERLVENVPGGKDMIEIVYVFNNTQHSLYLNKGESEKVGQIGFSYENLQDSAAIQFVRDTNQWSLTAPFELFCMEMSGNVSDTLSPGESQVIDPMKYYVSQGVSFIFKKSYQRAVKQIVAGTEEDKGADALVVDVSYAGKQQEVTIIGGPGYIANFVDVNLEGQVIKLAYGDKKISLPFALRLDDFILDRYAGSMSPSSYASEVTLIDEKNNRNEKHRIFMNNVLDYRGYRFFQSSYDVDEKGTILSVNHDFWGTWITYAGYFFLGLGFVLTLLNRNSRFLQLSRNIRELRNQRKMPAAIIILFTLGFSLNSYSQKPVQPPVSPAHAGKFGQLLVQTYDGRFEPVHTMAYDILHKVSRKDQFDIPGKGKMNALQVYLDIMMDGQFWQQQKIIYIREESVREVLGINGKYASILDFYDKQSKYKLAEITETSFRKKQSEQNKFDKEIIKLDERLNVFISALNGSSLKIFPHIGSPTNTWLHTNDSLSFVPLTGPLAMLGNELQLPQVTYSNILRSYFVKVTESAQSGDYSAPEKILSIIESVQRQYTPEEILPSNKMVRLEIYYNEAEIFIKLRNWYGILSLVLLFLAFADTIRAGQSKFINWGLKFTIGVLAFTFVYFSFGMGLRWYLSGHAPWSNGYEALLLMAWGSLLAGFIFSRYSSITLAATVLLAASMLMTASHSSYDPQLTNLQPVLKSYWLIIHVAIITISYGFLGLGFVLGIIYMFISLFKNKKNKNKLTLLGEELTHINEMNLTVGLFLATLGTFLGGIWANESWGRYWGWDAKETWALVIVIVYAMILHFRMVPKMKSAFVFNVGSIFGFGSVLMTFIGVNYYLSKGLHSYAADDNKVFPGWAWGLIMGIFLLIILAGIKERSLKQKE
ncbi:MAG: cytochrome c biogenesis protein CcsA [Bacteroidales bacterium]